MPPGPWRGIRARGPPGRGGASEALPEDYREVIVLRSLEELPFEEVARRMARSSGAVRMLWGRAIAEMGKALKELGITA